MKHVLLFGLMLASFLSYSQYPASGAKQRLGWQTTGDGLVYRGAIADTSTLDPSGLNNAWMLLDTVSGNLYAYRIKAWRLVSGGGGGGITMPLDSVAFNTSYVSGFPTGTMAYDADNETVSVGIDGGVVYQSGQELFYPVVVNKSDSLIKNGQLVMVDTATLVQGDHVRVVQARNGANYPSNYIMGVATTDIPDDSTGLVTFFGYVREVKHADIAQSGDTLVPGNILYPSPTEPGRYTNVPPSTPAHKSTIALVVRKPSPNNMTLLVRPWLAPKLEDASDVDTAGISQNSILRYDTASGYWKASTTAGIVAGDTAAMLTNYINVADTATMLSSYISNADTSVFARDWQISGSTWYLPRFKNTNSLENSPLYNSGNKILMGTTSGNLLKNNFEIRAATASDPYVQTSMDIYFGNPSTGIWTPYVQLYRSRDTTVTGFKKVENGDWLGRLTFQGADGAKYIRGAQMYALVDATTGLDSMSTALRFATNPGNLSEPADRMSITSTGRVGIGTTSPGFKLSVLGADSCCGTPRISAQFRDGLNSAFYVAHTGPHPTPGYATLLGSSDDLAFGQIQSGGTSEYIRIKATTGRVGIGTSSPARSLHISATDAVRIPVGTDLGGVSANGDIRFNTTANNFEWYSTTSGAWRKPVISASATGLNSAGNFAYFKSTGLDSSNVLTQSNGRIGIGVTPTEALQVNGTARATRFILNTFGSQTLSINNYAPSGTLGSNLWIGSGGQSSSGTSGASGSLNAGIGDGALFFNTTGFYNLAFGVNALLRNTTGNLNVSIGGASSSNNLDGSGNTAIGGNSLSSNTSGSFNIAIGYTAMEKKVTGSDNVAIGREAGNLTAASTDNTASDNSIYIGSSTKTASSGRTGEIVIGHAAVGNGSNTTTIGNTSTTATYIPAGKMYIGGTTAPTATLHVNGSLSRNAPVTVTANYTVAETVSWIVCDGTATIALTLPAAASWTGREIMVKTIQPYTVTSASANVVPIDGVAATNAILPATDGAWATLVSDGTNWIIMQQK